MHQNGNPAAVGTASGAGNALTDRSDSRLELPTSKAKSSYWIAGRTEFWRIPNTDGINEDGDIIYLSPPGKGWFAPVEDRDDTHTLWQRRRRS